MPAIDNPPPRFGSMALPHTIRAFLAFFLLIAVSFMAPARETPLSVQDAFGFSKTLDAHGVRIHFQIAEGYHLYRERLRIEALSPGLHLKPSELPQGEIETDPSMGSTAVLRGSVEIRVEATALDPDPAKNQIRLSYQGCQDDGSCYPPQKETISLEGISPTPLLYAESTASQCAPDALDEGTPSEQCTVALGLKQASFLGTLTSFLGMGVLLAFTPCIFPMIPILSGLIAGQGETLTRGRAFSLSLAYVLASALAYTGFGVLAGLFGQNLQSTLQTPGVIIAFSTLFLILALSMFGVFSLQLPHTLQSYFNALSGRQTRGTLVGAATMGFFSALIVGPCVAAPLAGALIYIGETGDAVLGGFALFALGLGMGLPLLAIGTSAGALLPRAGAWMNHVKTLFGFGLLGVGVQLISRLLPGDLTLSLWGGFLILGGMALGALEPLAEGRPQSLRLARGLGVIALIQGALFLVGGASGADDPRHPLSPLTEGRSKVFAAEPPLFESVASLKALHERLAAARAEQRPVLVDVSAEWCTACKEMDQLTYRNPEVRAALQQVIRVKADVTDVNPETTALLRALRLVGPPATLFFRGDGNEVRQRRIVGFMEPEPFLKHIQAALGPLSP